MNNILDFTSKMLGLKGIEVIDTNNMAKQKQYQ